MLAGCSHVLATLLLALLPAAAAAQARVPPELRPTQLPSRQAPELDARQTPLEVLLEQRGALQLSPQQLQRLERVQQRLERQNEPLVGRMLMLRQQWQAEQQAARRAGLQETPRLVRIRAAAEPLRERLQENNRAAMQAVNQVLTPQQRTQLRQLLQDGGRPGAPGVGRPPAGRRPPLGAPPGVERLPGGERLPDGQRLPDGTVPGESR